MLCFKMEESVVAKYLDRLEELVFIEENIVTCISLCQTLSIHVNTAKQLLFLFSQKEEYREKILVMYLIGGTLPNGGVQMKLVEADKREETRKQFDHVTMDHVYSIQKSEKFSLEDVYNANPSFHLPSDTRLLLCPIRPPHTIGKRNIKKIAVAGDKKDTAKSSLLGPSTSKPMDESKKEIVSKATKSDSPQKTKKASPEKNKKANNGKPSGGSISSFFNRQADKKTTATAKNSVSEVSKKSPPVKPNEKEAKGIGSFFKDVPSKVTTEEGNSKPAKHEENNRPSKPSKYEDDKEAGDSTEVSRKQLNGVAKNTANKTSKNTKRKKKNKEKDESNLKKRRRIMAMDTSSEDSDQDGNDSEEEMREEAMEVDEEPPPPVIPEEEEEDMIPPTPGRKKVRRQVDKVFTDDEGFVLTKKEYVYESCTDDEAVQEEKENINNKVVDGVKTPATIGENVEEIGKKTAGKEKSKKQDKPPPSKIAKKASPKGPPKSQASITNFFTKK